MRDLQTLEDGYRDFFRRYFRVDDSIYQQLKASQSPLAMVIACSDSRVDPAMLTNADPGDLFVVRNVANLVPAYSKSGNALHGFGAALEYAVNHLCVPSIVIIGHRHCGGINALVNSYHKEDESDFIGNWVKLGQPAYEQSIKLCQDNPSADLQHTCEKQSVIQSLNNLLSYPWLLEKVKKGELETHGWYFDFTDGSLSEFDHDTQEFMQIETE